MVFQDNEPRKLKNVNYPCIEPVNSFNYIWEIMLALTKITIYTVSITYITVSQASSKQSVE